MSNKTYDVIVWTHSKLMRRLPNQLKGLWGRLWRWAGLPARLPVARARDGQG